MGDKDTSKQKDGELAVCVDEVVSQLVQTFWDLHMEAYRKFDRRETGEHLEFYRGEANAFLKAYELLDEIVG